MCAALPAQIVDLTGETALVDFGSSRRSVGRRLAPQARPGDWVLINAGQIVGIVSPDEAAAIQDLLRDVLTLAGES